MTQNEMKTFQLILKEKGVEMTKALRNREGILIEKAADELDEITTALERDIAVQKLDRESRLLRQILGALSRIESGTFGTCLHCDEEISQKRLAAVPWAPFCLVCAGGPPPQDWRGTQKDYLQDWLPRAKETEDAPARMYASAYRPGY
jgi:DnaK suppressor protein